MANKTETLLNQQNNLLEHQNVLLEQMNNLLQQKIIPATSGETFVENIDVDEIRSGFLVTSHRKKLWNVQIGLINEFARICKKYNLRWFAYGGTLLGAARHKGFIPWDDDVDLIMLRPDYEKFKRVAAEEIKEPYSLDIWYNYRVEDDNKHLPEESNLPIIYLTDKHKYRGYWPFCPWLKIRDNRTTMIEIPYRKNINQGIWIDIFPLDPAPPFENGRQADIYQISRLLIVASIYPSGLQGFDPNKDLPKNLQFINDFFKFTYSQKGKYLEDFLIQNYFDSQFVRHITEDRRVYKKHIFENTIYSPFEKMQIPIPANYEEILKVDYGDWKKMVISYGHSPTFSVNIPYKEYFQKSLI